MNYWALTSRDSDSVGLGISGHGKTLQVIWCVTTITNITWAIRQCWETNLLQSAQPLRIWPLLCLLYRWGNWSPGEFMDTQGHKWVGSRAWMNAGDPSSFNILDGEVRAPLFPLGPFPKGKILSLTEMQAKDWQETPRARVFESICFISIKHLSTAHVLANPMEDTAFLCNLRAGGPMGDRAPSLRSGDCMTFTSYFKNSGQGGGHLQTSMAPRCYPHVWERLKETYCLQPTVSQMAIKNQSLHWTKFTKLFPPDESGPLTSQNSYII